MFLALVQLVLLLFDFPQELIELLGRRARAIRSSEILSANAYDVNPGLAKDKFTI